MRCIATGLLALALARPVSAQPSTQAPDSVRVARLAALGKIWNAARLLHPWLAYKPIDWDAALVAAIPRVRAATTAAEYAAALAVLVEPLNDPLTRVVAASTTGPRSTGEPQPAWRWTDDRVLLVTLTNYADAADLPSLQRMGALAPRIDSARAVVFDVRRLVPGVPGVLGWVFANSGMSARLVADTLRAPGSRTRMHSGYRSDTGAGASFYYSAWQTTDGTALLPAPGTTRKPIVFVVNAQAELPAVALALLAAGRAGLVAEGGFTDSGTATQLPMGEGVAVTLRLSETVFADGSVGIVADTVVGTGAGDAVEVALSRARANRLSVPPSAPRGAMPVAQPPRAYPEMRSPALPYRLLAAYRIWGVFEYFNPYRHLVADEWATVLEDFIPAFEAAEDSVAYADAVGRMLVRTHDSHVRFAPSAHNSLRRGVLPARIRWIESKPVVTSVLDTAAARAGLRVGDVILSVDGVPADTLIATLARIQPASTPHARMRVVMTLLGSGPEGSEAVLRVERGVGAARDVRVRRHSTYAAQAYRSGRDGPIFRILEGNIGYADLERLTVPMVDSMFRVLKGTRAIVFDMRGYPQGTAWSIAPRLVDRPGVPAALFRRPIVAEPRGFGASTDIAGQLTYEFTQFLGPPVAPRYTGRTVMLIDERAISQSEHTGLFLKAANGTTFIGTPTVGANGDVTQFVIPGGIAISFTGHDVRHPDGRQLQRIGLQPDILVAPTIRGIRENRDEVLERAIRFVQEGQR